MRPFRRSTAPFGPSFPHRGHAANIFRVYGKFFQDIGPPTNAAYFDSVLTNFKMVNAMLLKHPSHRTALWMNNDFLNISALTRITSVVGLADVRKHGSIAVTITGGRELSRSMRRRADCTEAQLRIRQGPPREINVALHKRCDAAVAARVSFDLINRDQRSSLLIGRIFCDEPVATSSENALVNRSG